MKLDDLISRAAALNALLMSKNYRDAHDTLEQLPSVDAVPVKRGRWINHKDEHQCSECKEITIVDFYVWKNVQFDYCPYCGTRMDGEEHAS